MFWFYLFNKLTTRCDVVHVKREEHHHNHDRLMGWGLNVLCYYTRRCENVRREHDSDEFYSINNLAAAENDWRHRLTSRYYTDWSTVFSLNTVYQRCCSRYSPCNSLVIYSINEIRMWIIGLTWVHVLHSKWRPFSTNRLGWLLRKHLSLSEIWVHSFDVGNHKIIETMRNNRTQRKLPFIQP